LDIMEIRSVTLFLGPDQEPSRVAPFLAAAQNAFHVPVQTTRLALPPFPEWWPEDRPVANAAADFMSHWADAGADYINLGPVQLTHDDRWLDLLPELLGYEEKLFAAVEIADTDGNVDLSRITRTAGLIRQVSNLRPDGFGNLFLTAIANCPPGSPFFPVAYQGGARPHFALAIEGADLAREAFEDAETMEEARTRLIKAIEGEAALLGMVADQLAKGYGIQYSGMDFSLAPYPEPEKSLGGALADLGLAHVGAPGSLFAAAFITDAIGRARFKRTGFSGLMLPVLEDSVLAATAADGLLSVNDLLSYAAVCGVGLDTIPLPGDVNDSALQGILLDVAALATRLRKPLTARLMPLPGKAAGDPIHFDFPYFADSRVMEAGQGVSGLLAAGGAVNVTPYGEEKKP
jgi:uncharacterized protein (UPF0210 family)